MRSALVASVNALKVSILNLESRKLRRVRELAQRAQRTDDLAPLPRGPIGGELKGGELIVGPPMDDAQAGDPESGDSLDLNTPIHEQFGGVSGRGEADDGGEKKRRDLTDVARRVPSRIQSEHLGGHLGQPRGLIFRGNHDTMGAPGVPLFDRGARGRLVLENHPKNSDGGEQSRSRAGTME